MWVLIAAILGTSMAIIDTTAVNVALPVMQRDLSASAAGLQWIVESYTLFLSALILVGEPSAIDSGVARYSCSGLRCLRFLR